MNSTQYRSVACIGGAHWDHKAHLERPVNFGTSNPATTHRTLGGVARNVAENLGRLGCPVSLFSVLGDDQAGQELVDTTQQSGVDCSAVEIRAGQATANYCAILDPDGTLVLGIADMAIYDALDRAWAEAVLPHISDHDVWVLDTNIPAAGLNYLLQHKDRKSVTLVDPVSVAKSARLLASLHGVDVLFPDLSEAIALSGVTHAKQERAMAAADRLCAMGVGKTIVSLGSAGIAVSKSRNTTVFPAHPITGLRDVTGAGDALLAGYAYGLIQGGPTLPETFGLAAASLTVEVAATVDPDLTPQRLHQRIAESTNGAK